MLVYIDPNDQTHFKKLAVNAAMFVSESGHFGLLCINPLVPSLS